MALLYDESYLNPSRLQISVVSPAWFIYRKREHGCEWENMSYPVKLDRTRCHFGG